MLQIINSSYTNYLACRRNEHETFGMDIILLKRENAYQLSSSIFHKLVSILLWKHCLTQHHLLSCDVQSSTCAADSAASIVNNGDGACCAGQNTVRVGAVSWCYERQRRSLLCKLWYRLIHCLGYSCAHCSAGWRHWNANVLLCRMDIRSNRITHPEDCSSKYKQRGSLTSLRCSEDCAWWYWTLSNQTQLAQGGLKSATCSAVSYLDGQVDFSCKFSTGSNHIFRKSVIEKSLIVFLQRLGMNSITLRYFHITSLPSHYMSRLVELSGSGSCKIRSRPNSDVV